jgi:hypothetical protein
MPIPVSANATTLLFQKAAFETAGLTRAVFDEWLNLTPEEFRVEATLIVIGPIYDTDALQALISALEDKGLVYYDDFFELSGNWPDWVSLHAMAARP